MGRPFKGVTFWDRVYNFSQREGACLIFTGCKDHCGYGRIHRDGKLVRVHREVWARDNGPIPDGLVIMHSCDNPACIELSHLSLGTQADNIDDMVRKGRRIVVRGSAQPQAKLREADIPIIRQRIKSGHPSSAISKSFGVSEGAIQNIKRGRNWTHVGGVQF